MLSHINSTSTTFKSRLAKLQQSYPQLIGEVRGRGLILGVQVKSVGGKSATDIATTLVTRAREKGLLIITAGEGTIRLVPALNIPGQVAAQGLDILEEAVQEGIREL
jgi:acetylornithine aminotransferase